MDRGQVISTSYPVVKTIFKHLDSRSLNTCAQVCTLWYSVSVREKKRRQDIFWILKDGTYQEQVGTDHSVMEDALFQEMKNFPIEPVFCIAFMSLSLITTFKKYFPSFCSCHPDKRTRKFCKRMSAKDFFCAVERAAFKDFLPKNCQVSLTVAEGIVGCSSNCVPMVIEESPAMSGIFIPKIEGVNINKLDLDRDCSLSKFIAKNSPVKALLVFSGPKYLINSSRLFKSGRLNKRHLKIPVFGGAYACHKEISVCSAIAFSGPNVEVASIVIDWDMNKEEITAKFKTFKETGLLRHKCFAIMFAPFKGEDFDQDHDESTTFCKMYPNVPLIGVVGMLVMGHDYFPMKNTLSPESFTLDGNILHVDSSVFVLISLKV